MNSRLGELTKSLVQSVTRRGALKKVGVSLLGKALAKFDRVGTNPWQSRTRWWGTGKLAFCLSAGLAAMGVAVGHAQVTRLGPLIQLSQPNPVGGCDNGYRLPGTITVNDALEPCAAVNPRNANNVVAVWILGPIQNIISTVSLNGGHTWQQVPIPLTTCSGGPYIGAANAWLTFSPNGDLYSICLAGNSQDARITVVNKSTDGGLHWSPPSLLTGNSDLNPGHPSITADPVDSRFVYAAWHGVGKNNLPMIFSRTTDGGLSWERPKLIFEPPPNHRVLNNRIFVLPDGTILTLYLLFAEQISKPVRVYAMRSSDRGHTWSPPTIAFSVASNSDEWPLTVDPETGQPLFDGGQPAFAMDRNNGNLYAVWEDARFSGFQYNEIAFSMSSDGGLSWSTPIRVNQAPIDIPSLNRQSFLPAIAVLPDGTIGVSYYDYRFNDSNPGVPTDYWLVQCHPGAPATDAGNWRNEVRLTDSSFDLQRVCTLTEGRAFLGNYVVGLIESRNSFVATFPAVDQNNITSMFARRVEP